MKYQDIRRYIGDISQVAGIRHGELKSGKGKGVETFDVRTGAGLEFTVLKDRCLDIAWASYKGYSLTHISNTGVVAPSFYDPQGIEFLRSFFVGLMTTCGLTYVGTPNVDQEQSLGLHGRIGNTPAEECGYEEVEENGELVFRIKGKVKEARFFGEHLVLERSISAVYGENRICVRDRIRNIGFEPQPLQMIYHLNYGFPLLSERAVVEMAVKRIRPRDARAGEGIGEHLRVEKPQPGYREQCFYIDFKTDEAGRTMVGIINESLGFGVYERFSIEQFPRFIQWKQMGEGFYVMGLEPANCYPDGRSIERQNGTLEYIDPGRSREFELEIGILEDADSVRRFRDELKTYR